MGRLDGKVAVVTGAARGQGRAAAVRMAQEGCALALTDVDAEGLTETADAVRASGGRAVEDAGDISAAATIDALAGRAIETFGRIDVLYNNAGISLVNTVEGYTSAEFDRLMHVNCLAHLIAIQRVLPEMRRTRSGSIINVSSIGGLVALPHLSVYCARRRRR